MAQDKLNYNYIVVEGNIGAGKTSLTNSFCEKFEAKGIYEQFVDNPFLPKFYENPDKYALQLELSFLVERYQQLKKELENTLFHSAIVADYYLKKSLIFAGETLTDIDFHLYSRIFATMTGNMQKPDLFLYLHQKPEKLLENIARRGRTYESNISKEYLLKIQNSYFRFFRQVSNFPIVVIDCENIDFVNNQLHLDVFYKILRTDFTNGYTVINPLEF